MLPEIKTDTETHINCHCGMGSTIHHGESSLHSNLPTKGYVASHAGNTSAGLSAFLGVSHLSGMIVGVGVDGLPKLVVRASRVLVVRAA